MKIFDTLLVSAFFAVTVLINSASANERGNSDNENPVSIRYLKTHGDISTLEMADAKGWLESNGIKLQEVGYTQGGPESLFALASGSVDIADAATTAVINSISSGTNSIGVVPTSGVSKTVNSKFYVVEDSPIQEPDDLRGKTIAVNTLGAHLDYAIRQYLKDNDIPYQAVRLVTVPGPQLEQVLRSGQVDVAAVGNWQTTFAGKMEESGGIRVLFTDHQVLGDIVQGFGVMNKSFIQQHPKVVESLVVQSSRVVDWARENPDSARQLIAEILEKRGENPEISAYWAGYGLRPGAEVKQIDVQYWLDILKQEGTLSDSNLAYEDIYNGKHDYLAQSEKVEEGL